jgi:hypothetical protein
MGVEGREEVDEEARNDVVPPHLSRAPAVYYSGKGGWKGKLEQEG